MGNTQRRAEEDVNHPGILRSLSTTEFGVKYLSLALPRIRMPLPASTPSRGRLLAERQGYPAAALDALPPVAVEAAVDLDAAGQPHVAPGRAVDPPSHQIFASWPD